jgi:hypothetical protein
LCTSFGYVTSCRCLFVRFRAPLQEQCSLLGALNLKCAVSSTVSVLRPPRVMTTEAPVMPNLT